MNSVKIKMKLNGNGVELGKTKILWHFSSTEGFYYKYKMPYIIMSGEIEINLTY